MDDPFKELSSKLRGWYNRSPKVQQAYEKLSADVDAVHAKMASTVDETESLRSLRDKIAAAIDPPAQVAPPTAEATASPEAPAEAPAASTASTATATATTPEAPMGLPIHAETTPESTPQAPTEGSPLP